MNLRGTLLASALIALPVVASAQAVNGLYVGGGAGVNLMQKEDVTVSGGGASTSGSEQPRVGPAVVVNLGWGFGNGLRAEAEVSYRWNNGVSSTQGFGNSHVSLNEQKIGGMANVLYDFVAVPVIQPYVGAGIGYQAEILQSSGLGPSSQTKGSLAYQAILGAAMPIAQVPGLAVTAEYRFMGLVGDRSYSIAGGGSLKSTDNYNHSILLGVRYAFGAPPLPPAPMPVADMGAKTFLVFFDWNKADLTARSSGIIRDAATYSTSAKYTRIDVDGNADTSGTPTYNQGLSERRARVVAAELVRDGVPQSAISMHAYGDTKLLVPTGPGVREPQNRRVEIVFH